MTHHEGLLLDFGGVVTTDFFAALGAPCERLGLTHDSFRNLVTTDPAGRELYHQVERGALSQPNFEQKIAQLLQSSQPASSKACSLTCGPSL
jgi:putative hydrolase of the HAD superfamily